MEGFIYIGIVALFIALVISFLIISKYPNEQFNIYFNLIAVIISLASVIISIIGIGGFEGLTIAVWSGTMCCAAIVSTVINTVVNFIIQSKEDFKQI